MWCFARLPRVAAYYSEVSWVVPTRVIRPKPLQGILMAPGYLPAARLR